MRVVVTGASGQLGAYLVERLEVAGLGIDAWSHRAHDRPRGRDAMTWTALDITQESAVLDALEAADPEVIFHLAAISSADAVHADPARGRAVNVTATEILADWCARRGRRLVLTSTDLVFDGSRAFSREDDPPNPLLMYGRTKVDAERAVLKSPRGLVARLSLLYGFTKTGRAGFFDRAISALRRGEAQCFFQDEYRTPLDYESAAAILMRLAVSDTVGVIHVAGSERLSRWELMSRAARVLDVDPKLVTFNSREHVQLAEPRPRDVSLDRSRLLRICPDIQDSCVEDAMTSWRPTLKL
jgi:dTDP-4-dehydrorhamnose reductase